MHKDIMGSIYAVALQSATINLAILSELLPAPVVRFPRTPDEDDALADGAAELWATLMPKYHH